MWLSRRETAGSESEWVVRVGLSLWFAIASAFIISIDSHHITRLQVTGVTSISGKEIQTLPLRLYHISDRTNELFSCYDGTLRELLYYRVISTNPTLIIPK